MQGAVNVRPIGNKILVERLEGHGIERVTDGGLVIPATCEAKARTKNDHFRARVLAVGPEAPQVAEAVKAGFDHVLVYAWCDHGQRGLYTGKPLDNRRLFIEPDDIVMAVTGDAKVEHRNTTAEVR
jgi:co-chaperonin GroES (HSP10)